MGVPKVRGHPVGATRSGTGAGRGRFELMRSLAGCWDCRPTARHRSCGTHPAPSAGVERSAPVIHGRSRLSPNLACLTWPQIRIPPGTIRLENVRLQPACSARLPLLTPIGAVTAFREGFLAAYPIYLRADAQARQLTTVSTRLTRSSGSVRALCRRPTLARRTRPRRRRSSMI